MAKDFTKGNLALKSQIELLDKLDLFEQKESPENFTQWEQWGLK